MAPHEKRASTRYTVSIDTEVTRGGDRLSARMTNLSLGGALIELSVEPRVRVGERIEVAFRLPDLDKPLCAKAEIRWLSGGDESAVGVQFVTGFRAKETWALGRFLERHAPA